MKYFSLSGSLCGVVTKRHGSLFCHDSLLNCWEDQTRRNGSHLSLFWTIFYAYGWLYMCLGPLKVLLESFF
ncbi:hypothetical protein Hanom_Chr12g01073301 [Helianthus anomalus]